ncbi:MAG: response regulator [Candidatus Omnitrophota bacterium]
MNKKKILMIEDEKDLLMLIKMNLESSGRYEVFAAHDGEEGLSKARSIHPDIIILDLNLPKLPGEEVCRQIRKDDETKNIPIIMATGKSMEADKIIGRVIGANAYITKPFQIDELLKEIEEVLDKSIPT